MSEKSDYQLLADAIMHSPPAPKSRELVRIVIHLLHSAGKVESKTVEVDTSTITVMGKTVYVPVWSGHVAELDLTRPDLGWTVFPD